MKLTFNENVIVKYSNGEMYINTDKFEYNSKLNKQIKTDFFYYLLMVVHKYKMNYTNELFKESLKKEKYLNYNKFTKLLYYIKNKLLLGDFAFSFNGYTVSYKRRNLYRKWLLYVLKYDYEASIRIQSLFRGYLVRKRKILISF